MIRHVFFQQKTAVFEIKVLTRNIFECKNCAVDQKTILISTSNLIAPFQEGLLLQQ